MFPSLKGTQIKCSGKSTIRESELAIYIMLPSTIQFCFITWYKVDSQFCHICTKTSYDYN